MGRFMTESGMAESGMTEGSEWMAVAAMMIP